MATYPSRSRSCFSRRSSVLPPLMERDGCWLVDRTPAGGLACVLWEVKHHPATAVHKSVVDAVTGRPSASDSASGCTCSSDSGSSSRSRRSSLSDFASSWTDGRVMCRRDSTATASTATASTFTTCTAPESPEDFRLRRAHNALETPGQHMTVGSIFMRRASAQIGNISNFHGPVTLVVGGDGCGPTPSDPLGDESLPPALALAATDSPPCADQKTFAAREQPKNVITFRGCAGSAVRVSAVTVAILALTLLALLAVAVAFLLIRDSAGRFAAPVKIVPRASWGAKAANRSTPPLVPLWWAIVFHDTGTDACLEPQQCVQQVRTLQRDHMDARGMDDIEFNFLVGGDGAVYEGRGWDAVGRTLGDWNHESLSVAMIGTFHDRRPTEVQVDAALHFVEWGMSGLERIRTDHKVAGACQFEHSDSPGPRVMELLVGWKHWWNHTTIDAQCTRTRPRLAPL